MPRPSGTIPVLLLLTLFATFPRDLGALAASDASPASTTQPVFAPPANLVVDGVPPIPASVAEEAARFTEFRSAGLAAWHPVRREVLVRTRFADVGQFHYVKMPLGVRKQLTFFPEPVDAAAFPPAPGAAADAEPPAFYFTKDVGGSEFDQIFRYDLASGDVTLLTDGTSRNSAPLFTR